MCVHTHLVQEHVTGKSRQRGPAWGARNTGHEACGTCHVTRPITISPQSRKGTLHTAALHAATLAGLQAGHRYAHATEAVDRE